MPDYRDHPMDFKKQCKVCMVASPAYEFKPDKRSADNLASTCNSCLEKREVHAVENARVHEALYVKQKCRCAICNRKVFLSKILVDIDPQTDAVMGLICRRCNRILRLAERDPRIIRSLFGYKLSVNREPVDPPRPPGRHEVA